MTIKTLLAAAALTVAPALAFAECSGGYHSEQQAMSCAEGSVYDATSGTCKVVNA